MFFLSDRSPAVGGFRLLKAFFCLSLCATLQVIASVPQLRAAEAEILPHLSQPRDADSESLQAALMLYAAGRGLRVIDARSSFRQVYEFNEPELIGIAGGVALALFSHYLIGTDDISGAEIQRLTPDSVRSVLFFEQMDRSAAYNWSPAASDLSDWGMYLSVAAPLATGAFFMPDKSAALDPGGAGDYIGAYAQTLSLSVGLNLLVKNLISRRRPYLFNTDLSLDKKLSYKPDYTRSFYSGHTSIAFTSAAFLTSSYAELYPDRDSRYLVGVLSFGTAALTGYLRYEAGKHFPSDIVVGAIVGTVFGFVVPQLD